MVLAQFFIDGKPQGKGRPKYSSRGKFVHAYTPIKTRTYEQHIKECAQNALGCPTNEFMGSLGITITCCFAPPKGVSKKKRSALLDGSHNHVKKPDLDNIIKCVCDALNGVLYEDDAQITSIQASKHYGEPEGITVVLYKV